MKELHVLNLGVGVQSTTLYLMACRGDFRLDYAIFSDTGDEPTEVYKHLAYLQSLNGIPILVRSKGRLSADLMRGENSTSHRFASIPAFTRGPSEDDDVGRTRRQCSKEYKIAVIEKTIRQELLGLKPKQRIPKDVKVVQYIGISLDEAGRAWPSHQQFTPTQVALMGEAEADALAVAILQQTNRYRREAAERAAKK